MLDVIVIVRSKFLLLRILMEKRAFKISLILEAFQNLEKAYKDLKKNLSISEKTFSENKLVQDRVRIDFNLAVESCMRVCRHVSAVLGLKTKSRDCLVKLGEYIGMEFYEQLEDLINFYFEFRDLKKQANPLDLYTFLKNKIWLFKEFAREVVEFIKRETGNYLLIDFDLLNEKSKHVKESVRRIDFVLSQGKEEFSSKPMYYERAKYFYQVAYDSLFDICRHLAPKFGIKKFTDDCLVLMISFGVIPKSYTDDVMKMIKLKNKLTTNWEIPPEELYEYLLNLKDKFNPLVKEISKSLKNLLEKRSKNP